MSYDYLKLWEPIKINKMRLRNRIMLSAMGTFTPMQDGTDSEEGIRYYEERAKGGAGLIMTGAMFLSEKTAQGGPTLNLYSTRAIPKATVMVERVHSYHAVPDVMVCRISESVFRFPHHRILHSIIRK